MILLPENIVVFLLLHVYEAGSASLPQDVHIHLHHGETGQVGDNFLGIKFGLALLVNIQNLLKLVAHCNYSSILWKG